MVIHQPRVQIWDSLDQVLLLAPGGITVYQGPQKLVEPYFTQHLNAKLPANDNPADGIMDEISKQGQAFAEIWKQTGKDFLDELLEKHAGELGIPIPTPVHSKVMEREEIKHQDNNNNNDDNKNIAIVKVQHVQSSSQQYCPPLNSRGAPFWKQVYFSHVRSVQQQFAAFPSLMLETAIAVYDLIIIYIN